MYKQFSITDLIKAVQERLKSGTGMKCLDSIPDNEPSPFYFVEFGRSTPANTKTTYMTDYLVNIHIIAEPTNSSVPIYKYINLLEEALTVDISIPEPYTLVMQTYGGVAVIKTDPTNEKHTICPCTFRVSYGLKCKI